MIRFDEGEKIINRLMMVDGIVYYVESYKQGMKEGFKKGKLYFDHLSGCALPYRGHQDDADELKCGIYKVSKKREPDNYVTRFPKGKERDKYSVENLMPLGDIFKSGDFIENDLILDIDGESFKPPIYVNDDMMLKLIKAGITLKNAPFNTYDNRFQKMDIGTNSYNRKSNAKKALLNNNSLSSTKALQFSDVMDFDLAIMIKNKPGALCPMDLPDNRPMVIYSREEFDTSNPVNIINLIERLNMSDGTEEEEE